MSSARSSVELVSTLVDLWRGEHSGVLEIDAEGTHTNVYVRRGVPVFAEQGGLRDTLGRVLVEQGALTQEQYAAVIDHMTSSYVDDVQMRFGEAAIALGYLTPDQVHGALAEQVRRKVMSCLQHEQPDHVFYEDASLLDEVASFPCAPPPLVPEGIRRFWDPSRTGPVLEPHLEDLPRLVSSATEIGGRFGLTAPELRLVRLVDGESSLSAMRVASPLDSLLTDQVLAALLLLGELDMHPPPSAAPFGRREAVRRRAAAIALQARRARGARPSERPRPSSGPARDEHQARLRAERRFQKGRHHMRYDAWAAASEELRRAFELQPDSEYELYALWAEYRAARYPSEREEARQRLAAVVDVALKRDRRFAFGHYVRGQLALLDGDDERAEKSFRNAVALDPDDVDAQRHLRLLVSRRQG